MNLNENNRDLCKIHRLDTYNSFNLIKVVQNVFYVRVDQQYELGYPRLGPLGGMVDTADLKSAGESRTGSSPVVGMRP